jgi:hypothetical protein
VVLRLAFPDIPASARSAAGLVAVPRAVLHAARVAAIRVTGTGKHDAVIKFASGGNVVAGVSNSGKSYMLRCMDFVLGAEEMNKKIDEAAGYELVFLEFADSKGKSLTLVRQLTGGDVTVHYSTIDTIKGDGTTVAWKRQGKSTNPDVSSVFLPFAGMKEARLRANSKGVTNRLTVRTLLPSFLVDETSIISERSPIYGNSGFDQTSRKRMLSYLLTGIDDEAVVNVEQSEIAQAEANAKLSLISELLKPIEQRIQLGSPLTDSDQHSTINRADEAIERLSSSLAEDRQERAKLQRERSDALTALQSAESQIMAIDELMARYALLHKRYDSDLDRLDFIAEGSYFLNGLQETRCPLCDQPMGEEHRHKFESYANLETVYASSQAEAAKILGLRNDLVETISTLKARRAEREDQQRIAAEELDRIAARIDRELAPALQATKSQLDNLIQRRLELEAMKVDTEQVDALIAVRQSLEATLAKSDSAPKKWEAIDSIAAHKFCLEIQEVLKEWSWKGQVQVEFDDKRFDIKVDGKARQSNGKGVRAILHAAFVVALLRFCHNNQTPHPGFIVLDSPLTTFKQGRDSGTEESIDPSIEAAFWVSIEKLNADLQIVVLDNKEPPPHVASAISYTWFAGPLAKAGERRGFIP